MKLQQLRTIKFLHETYCNLAEFDRDTPDENAHLLHAITTGEAVKIRPIAELLSALGRRQTRYGNPGQLSVNEIFTCPSLKKVIAEHAATVADRKKRVAAYRAVADPIVLAAELDAKSDAVAVSAQLDAAAKKAGI